MKKKQFEFENQRVLGVLSYFVDSLRGSSFFFALCEISARNCKLKKKNLLMFKRLSIYKGKKKKRKKKKRSKREFIDGRK